MLIYNYFLIILIGNEIFIMTSIKNKKLIKMNFNFLTYEFSYLYFRIKYGSKYLSEINNCNLLKLCIMPSD